jgi:hypothetical protein
MPSFHKLSFEDIIESNRDLALEGSINGAHNTNQAANSLSSHFPLRALPYRSQNFESSNNLELEMQSVAAPVADSVGITLGANLSNNS